MFSQASTQNINSDIMVLYELSLAVGASLDLEKACDVFCHTLMVRKNLDYSGVWINGKYLSSGSEDEPVQVYSHPNILFPKAEFKNNPELQNQLEADGFFSCEIGKCKSPKWTDYNVSENSIATWFQLGEIGFMLLLSSSRTSTLSRREMSQLRNVMDKFAISLEGCLAHKNLVVEYEERVRSERALVSSRFRNEWLANNVADVIWTMNSDFKFTFVSPVVKRFIGYSFREVMAMDYSELLVQESISKISTLTKSMGEKASPLNLYNHETFTIELGFKSAFNSTVWGEASIRLVEGGGDQDLEIMGVIRDITHRKQSEEMLVKAKEAAEENSRAKTHFLANMSHEIRTPLNGVIGMARFLARTELDKGQKETVNTINKSAESLLGIINNILDFSKIEAGKMVMENLGFNIFNVIEDVMRQVSPEMEAKNLAFYCDVSPDLHDYYIGDPLKIHQVLQNLVTNAIKFTERGYIQIKIREHNSSPDESRLVISVEDTGIGIIPERREKIFESFTQVDNTTSRKFGGTGLGLAICKQLADLMGAKLSVKGNNGYGSCFTFDLLLKKGIEKRSEGREKTDGLANKKVMIICDDNHLEWLLKRQLTYWGMVIVDPQLLELNGLSSKKEYLPDVVVSNCQNFSVTDSEKLWTRLPGGFQNPPLLRLNSPLVECNAKASKQCEGAQIQLPGPVCRRTLYLAMMELLTNNDTSGKTNHPEYKEAKFLKVHPFPAFEHPS